METQENKTLLDAGAALASPKTATETGSFVLLPDDYSVHSLEELLPTPNRKRGTKRLNSAESFIDYIKLHITEDTQIYGDITLRPRFVVVFNDDGKHVPGWGDFKAHFECPLSIEWRQWDGNDKKVMKQAEFADFIERNSVDIIEPSPADMLEISRTLEAKKKVNFASGIRLANGQQELLYEEEIRGTASKGKLEIPETFKIGIEAIVGGGAYSIECRLRYRIQDANLLMWYEMVRPHKVLEDAANAAWKEIEEKTGKKIFRAEV